MSNPKIISWTAPTQNTDGSPFDQSQFKAWELAINGQPAVSIPAGWDVDGHYEFPLADVSAIDKTGDYVIALRVINVNGAASEYSNSVSFSMDFRVPAAPSGLSVA